MNLYWTAAYRTKKFSLYSLLSTYIQTSAMLHC